MASILRDRPDHRDNHGHKNLNFNLNVNENVLLNSGSRAHKGFAGGAVQTEDGNNKAVALPKAPTAVLHWAIRGNALARYLSERVRPGIAQLAGRPVRRFLGSENATGMGYMAQASANA